jgi:hypothetical protein
LAEITRLAVAAPVTFTKVGDVLGARGLNFAARVPVDVNLLDVE